MFSNVVYRLEDDREISLSSSFNILPVSVGTARPAGEETVMDGKLSEWEGFPYKLNISSPRTGDASGYQGDFDASCEFAVAYDEEFLYIAISIWDDELVTSRNGSIWNQDAARLTLDARPRSQSACGRGENPYEDFLFLDFTLPATREHSILIYQEEQLPVDVLVKGTTTIQGADVEIAVPVDYLKMMNGDDWMDFRLNLAYFDQDAGGSRTVLWWKPDWGSAANYPGSGMFFRED
jgi:hypothetical protein